MKYQDISEFCDEYVLARDMLAKRSVIVDKKLWRFTAIRCLFVIFAFILFRYMPCIVFMVVICIY